MRTNNACWIHTAKKKLKLLNLVLLLYRGNGQTILGLTMNFVRIQRCFFFYMPFSDFCAILNGPTPYNSIWLLNKIVE